MAAAGKPNYVRKFSVAGIGSEFPEGNAASILQDPFISYLDKYPVAELHLFGLCPLGGG